MYLMGIEMEKEIWQGEGGKGQRKRERDTKMESGRDRHKGIGKWECEGRKGEMGINNDDNDDTNDNNSYDDGGAYDK